MIIDLGLENLLENPEEAIAEVCPDELLMEMEEMKDAEATLDRISTAFENLYAIHDAIESGIDQASLESLVGPIASQEGLGEKIKGAATAVVNAIVRLINKMRVAFAKFFNLNKSRIGKLQAAKWDKLKSNEKKVKMYESSDFAALLKTAMEFAGVSPKGILAKGANWVTSAKTLDKVQVKEAAAKDFGGNCSGHAKSLISVMTELPKRLDELGKTEAEFGKAAKETDEKKAAKAAADATGTDASKPFKEVMKEAKAQVANCMKAYNQAQKISAVLTKQLLTIADK